MITEGVSDPDLIVGQRVGSYVVQRLIGQGGMSHVYEGRDERLHRRAAIKVMDATSERDSVMTERFIREARTIASLDHPNIVSIYEFGDQPVWYLAMKFLEGETLFSVLSRLRQQRTLLDPSDVVVIVAQIAAALDYAHGRGILHRDIKPANIMLSTDGRTILMDFGLAMELDSQSTPGAALGTPRYMAPEQAVSSRESVPQSDIYSLGVVLYEMATGRTPFDDESPMNLALSHVVRQPPLPTTIRPDLPHPVQTVILKALEKRPENRWQTATALAEALYDAYAGIEPAVTLSAEDEAETRPELEAIIPASSDEETLRLPSTKPAHRDQRRRSGYWLPLLALGAIALAVLAVFSLKDNQPVRTPISAAPPAQSRLRLIYSPDSFAIYNATGDAVSLEGITFARGGGNSQPFPAANFGEHIHKALSPGQCLRIAIRGAERDVPLACEAQARLLIYDDPRIAFWSIHQDVDAASSFRVELDGRTLQTCSMRLNTCEFSLP